MLVVIQLAECWASGMVCCNCACVKVSDGTDADSARRGIGCISSGPASGSGRVDAAAARFFAPRAQYRAIHVPTRRAPCVFDARPGSRRNHV